MDDESRKLSESLARARQEGPDALVPFMECYRERLTRMVRFRMDRRLAGRIDPSDVIQDAFAEAWTRLGEYVEDPAMPFFLWLRFLATQRLMMAHRHHLGTQARDAAREVSLDRPPSIEATSAALAAHLMGSQTTPSKAAARAEMEARVEEALNSMDPMDREVIALRHFEQLNNVETAQVLGVPPATASKRYVRAMIRLRQLLTTGASDEELPGP